MDRGNTMKKTYIDPETGWTVTMSPGSDLPYGKSTIDTYVLTNPETGESHKKFWESKGREPDIAAWVRKIPRGPLGRIKRDFAAGFASWEISLPEEAVIHRRRGKICQGGWAIWYLFGSDEQGEYLDYYSAHRMTNDGHVRLYENGHKVSLPAISSFHMSSEDPEEAARLAAEAKAEAREIAAMLEAKGFGMEGDEPGAVQIIRYQVLKDPE